MTAQSPNYAPRVFVDTTDLSREEWLAYRRQGIGGSDAAAIMGISPFRTARDIYYDKLNLVTVDEYEGNWVALRIGHLLEDLVAEIFTKMAEYGIEPKRMRLVHPYVDKEPNMVLIEGSNKGRSRIQIEPPLIVYEKDGNYTKELLLNYGMGRAGEE